MNTKIVKATEVSVGDKIVFTGNNNQLVSIGIVDKIYTMVDKKLQFRFLPGSNIFSALTENIDAEVRIAA